MIVSRNTERERARASEREEETETDSARAHVYMCTYEVAVVCVCGWGREDCVCRVGACRRGRDIETDRVERLTFSRFLLYFKVSEETICLTMDPHLHVCMSVCTMYT